MHRAGAQKAVQAEDLAEHSTEFAVFSSIGAIKDCMLLSLKCSDWRKVTSELQLSLEGVPLKRTIVGTGCICVTLRDQEGHMFALAPDAGLCHHAQLRNLQDRNHVVPMVVHCGCHLQPQKLLLALAELYMLSGHCQASGRHLADNQECACWCLRVQQALSKPFWQ